MEEEVQKTEESLGPSMQRYLVLSQSQGSFRCTLGQLVFPNVKDPVNLHRSAPKETRNKYC